MKIALVQTNPLVGAFARNVANVLQWVDRAKQDGCALVIFPELTLCGYPPQDLLERSSFLVAHDQILGEFIQQISGIACLIGAPERREGPGKPLYNSALLIEEGRVAFRARKQLLPTYDVFDESRYFQAGSSSTVVPFRGLHLGLSVCEDIWHGAQPYLFDPIAGLMAGVRRPDCLINISASPYHHGKINERHLLFTDLCRRHQLPLLYVNQVGGQDSLVFDGHSMIIDESGTVCAAARGFAEDMLVVDSTDWQREGVEKIPEDSIHQVFKALILGVRDYLHKSGFKQAVIGLSGGIDSAVTAAIACRALGPENVLCVALPSPYTSEVSVEDARQLAENFACRFALIPIKKAMNAYQEALAPFFAGHAEDVTEQNIQARIRGNILMALSNKFGHLLLSTGNKSEMAVGYCTLYGDMSGGLAVLSDVPKVMVYALARWINKKGSLIPERIIIRPPTAELKPDQLDQDDLPPYEVLDPILAAYLEEKCSVAEIVARGFAENTVRDIIRRITINEYKRRQAPLGIKVTTKAFGCGRRYPVVQGFVE